MLVDTLLAGVVTVLALATVAGHTAPPLVIVPAVLSAAPIAVRRRAPMSALLVMGASPVAYLLLYGTAPNTGIGLLVGVFSVATYRPRPVAAAGWLVATTLLAIAYARIPTGMNWLGFTEGAADHRGVGAGRQHAQRLTNTQIANRLVLSETTVKTHVKRIMGKLRLSSRAQAVVVAYETGLVVPSGSGES